MPDGAELVDAVAVDAAAIGTTSDVATSKIITSVTTLRAPAPPRIMLARTRGGTPTRLSDIRARENGEIAAIARTPVRDRFSSDLSNFLNFIEPPPTECGACSRASLACL
ncbi:hypothetical protein GCM10028856_35490 [Halopiger thermotolerans]